MSIWKFVNFVDVGIEAIQANYNSLSCSVYTSLLFSSTFVKFANSKYISTTSGVAMLMNNRF